ncbi:hypothetical protein [Bosea sp. 2RAB26]|uniref:hypothetical protein n=1 Tax=Bosea sp. 2RAB26 TaxID=3237476 RepID=UPI003F8ECF75
MKLARSCRLLIIGMTSFLVAQPAQSAGLLDDLARALFGQPRPPPQVYFVPPAPLSVTVHPKRRQQPRKLVASKPTAPVVKLDPAVDPYWYLDDPTLRRGDIVVTHADVLVFEGRASQSHRASDFTALNRSRLVSKATQQRVGAATGAHTSVPPAGVQTMAARDPAN